MADDTDAPPTAIVRTAGFRVRPESQAFGAALNGHLAGGFSFLEYTQVSGSDLSGVATPDG